MTCLSTGEHDIVGEFPLCFGIGLPPLLLCRQCAASSEVHRWLWSAFPGLRTRSAWSGKFRA